MTDDPTKTPDPAAPAESPTHDVESEKFIVQAPAPELPEGKTLRAYLFYEPALRCTDCHTQLTVKVFDGQAPRGHDDNIRYQEIVVLGIGHCPRCSIKVVSALKGVTS